MAHTLDKLSEQGLATRLNGDEWGLTSAGIIEAERITKRFKSMEIGD